jgi:membrane protease YdiL (CAAX protease family)
MTSGTVAAPRLFSWRDWRDAGTALAFTAVIVFAGEAFGTAMTEAMRHLLPDTNATFIQVSGPVIVATYQVALLWFLAGWWFGAERRPALGLIGTPIAWWVWPAAIVGLYAVKAVISIAVLYVALNGAIPPLGGPPMLPATGDLSPFGALMRSPAWPLMLLGGIMAAIVEELLYRGYLSRTLEASRLGFWGGAAIAAIVWAALHVYYPWPMQIVLVAMGLALSWLRARTGSILPGMAWHIANNTIALVALRMLG